MKILLTTNKTYRGSPDAGFWYTYVPLQKLGHEVYWYDTVDPEEKDYNKIIENFKPDLIFCCMTGDRAITPHEPWGSIKKETDSGRTKTFNWFCDDTWRFDGFSSKVCRMFNVCSTPEPSYLESYKNIGYDNIILGPWYANSFYYPNIDFAHKDIDISFIGFPTQDRKAFFDACGLPIHNAYGITHEEMFETHSRSKMGLNLSTNDNDPQKKTQMKQRLFEVPAGGGLLITQYHPGIEEFFEIDKEIITFKSIDELQKKTNFLLQNSKILEKMARAGHKRFIAEHNAEIRLKKVLREIDQC
jgi:spore maturation protein CgeB